MCGGVEGWENGGMLVIKLLSANKVSRYYLHILITLGGVLENKSYSKSEKTLMCQQGGEMDYTHTRTHIYTPATRPLCSDRPPEH